MVLEGIYSILNADSAVNTAASGGIYPVRPKQTAAPPYVFYYVESVEPYETKDGVSTVDLFRIVCVPVAKTYSAVADLASKIRTAIDGYQGTAGGVVIDSIVYEDVEDFQDKAGELFFQENTYSVRVKN